MVAEGCKQAVFLCLRNRNDGAMTWCELAFGGCILHYLEVFQVGTLAELIVVAGVAIVHHYP